MKLAGQRGMKIAWLNSPHREHPGETDSTGDHLIWPTHWSDGDPIPFPQQLEWNPDEDAYELRTGDPNGTEWLQILEFNEQGGVTETMIRFEGGAEQSRSTRSGEWQYT